MSCSVHTYIPNEPCDCESNATVKEMFAFLVVDPNDKTEGVPAFSSLDGPLPMMGADAERMASMRPIAQRLATQMGLRIEMVKFTQRENVGWIEP